MAAQTQPIGLNNGWKNLLHINKGPHFYKGSIIKNNYHLLAYPIVV